MSKSKEELVKEILELREALSKDEGIIDSIIEGLGITDATGNIIQVNSSLIKMFGFDSSDEMLGKSVTSFIAEKNIESTMEGFKKCLTNGIATNFQFSAVKKDGSPFTCLLNAAVLKGKNNELIGVLTTLIDITEHTEAEER
ncbi:MAG: PAS domain S-box protein [bacterium]|nr:PAS domain S-box protein [bacterium]